MADSREMTYGIKVDTGEAQSNVDSLHKGIGGIETAANQVSSSAASALGDIGGAAADVASEASRAAADMGGAFRDAGDDASGRFRKMGADASSFGAAFKQTTAAAIKDGQSLAKSFQTGVSGAIAFTGKKFTTFRNDVSTGAKKIGTALMHPVQTIKGKLVEALGDGERAVDDLGDKADDTKKDLSDMGKEGKNAGDTIGKSIGNAIKIIAGLAVIKKSIDLVKNFIGSTLDAAKATENVGAKFDRLFAGTQAEEWANNYATAVNRSTNEVKAFLVQNKAMFTEMGITGDAATQLSEITTSLAYDFGNAFKMDDAEALAAIQSGLQGNTSALAEFGINLDDATLKAEALKLGISAELSELDEATKAQLRMNAILDQSSDIQQAAINQTGGLVNSTKSLQGIWENFMGKAGAKFTPVMEKLFNTIIKAWPKIEPALMGLVDILSEGLQEVIPIVADLGTSLLPVLADIIGVVFQAVQPLLPVFTSLAQQILPPLAALFGELARSILPPLTDIFMTIVDSVLMPLLPILQELIAALLPPFVQLLSMIAPILQMLSPILTMVAQLLLPIAEIIGQLISAILPPLMDILGVVFSLLTPIIEALMPIVQALLPPLANLLTAILVPVLQLLSPILSALSPVLEVIGSVLKVIADVLGKVIGWLADGVGKVVGFFSNLFGGAKESKKEVEGLNGAVNGLDEATNKDITLNADTSSYASEITSASEEANKAAQDNIIETKDISDLNLKLMGTEASSTYSTMAIDAESAWSRMTKAAEDGATKIVSAFQKILSAAQNASSAANINVSASGIPGHAGGTNDFEGGWTKINERGGELAFLPSGSAILPADQSDRIMAGATTNNNTSENTTSFEPRIEITVQGTPDSGAIDEMTAKLKAMCKELYEEMRQDELVSMTLKNAYA